MKFKTFFVSTLFLPYLCWIAAKLLSPETTPPDVDNGFIPELFSKTLSFINFIFASTIWVWGIPYTVLVIGLILWSKNKTDQQIYKIAFYSPLLLTLLVVLEIAIIVIYMEVLLTLDGTQPILTSIAAVFLLTFIVFLVAAIVITPIGYGFIGIGLMVCKMLVYFKAIVIDEAAMPGISSLVFRPFKEILADIKSP